MSHFNLNHTKAQRKLFIYILGVLLFLTLITFMSTIIHSFIYDDFLSKNYRMILVYFYIWIFINGICLQFICAAVGCRDRISLINERISRKYRLSSQEICNFIGLYKKLFKISSEINATLTTPLLPILAIIFISLIFDVYTFVRTIVKSSVDFPIVIGGISSLIIYITPPVAIIYAAESNLKEIEDIKEIGYDVLCNRRIFDKETKEIFMIFLHSINIQKIRLQTIFFDLDWKLIFKVITTKYLKFSKII